MTDTRVYKLVRKVLVTTLGTCLLLAGLVMWPFPTPLGIPLLMLGLVTLSAEYHWPRKAMHELHKVPGALRRWYARSRAFVRRIQDRHAMKAGPPPRMAPEEE